MASLESGDRAPDRPGTRWRPRNSPGRANPGPKPPKRRRTKKSSGKSAVRVWRFQAPRTLGARTRRKLSAFEFEEQVVVQHSRGMNHSAERRHRVSNLGKRAGQIAFVRNIGLDRRDGGAFGGQFGDDLFGRGGSSAAAEENQVPRAFFHQPARDGEPQASVASRDQIRGIGSRSRGPIRRFLDSALVKESTTFPIFFRLAM